MTQKCRFAQYITFIWTILLNVCDSFAYGYSRTMHIATYVPPHIQMKMMNTGCHCITTKQRQQPAFFRSHGISALQLSKKKSVPASVKKIQVKMLKYVEGTGHVGEIVMVTPAFFQNKLRPSQSAVMITNEEVLKAKTEAEILEKQTRLKAEALKERIADLSIVMERKAGPDGHLFGGIGPKNIMDELEKSINDEFLKQKGVRIISITNEDGFELDGDIKHTGVFKASLSLTKDLSGIFGIIVESER